MASNLRVDSIVPATGGSVSIGTATGGVNIPGVLTYEDVTNVDSVGIVTARTGIKIGPSVGVAATIFADGSINTSGINLNQVLGQLSFGQVPVIGSGSTVTSIGAGTITISSPSLNTTGITTVVSFGSTVFSNYALDFFSEENQDTTFESNDIIESEADDLLDFSEGNPFGTF